MTNQQAFELGKLTYERCRGVVAQAPFASAALNAEWWEGYHAAKNRKPTAIDDGTQNYGQRPMGAGK